MSPTMNENVSWSSAGPGVSHPAGVVSSVVLAVVFVVLVEVTPVAVVVVAPVSVELFSSVPLQVTVLPIMMKPPTTLLTTICLASSRLPLQTVQMNWLGSHAMVLRLWTWRLLELGY